MIAEVNQAKRYLGARFGYGEAIPDGIYPVPTDTSKGPAFMALEITDNGKGMSGFKLFWNEELTVSWYDAPRPGVIKVSKFSLIFRLMELLNEEDYKP